MQIERATPTYQVNTTAPMPNLENLKKQAKQYLRWHRERYHPVAAIIRAALPRFGHLSDEQVLNADFKLADAQELVARQRGFKGWQALKSGAHAMTHSADRAVSRPVLTSTAAQIFVADIKASCSFYADKLGFAVDFIYAIRRSTRRFPAIRRGWLCGWSVNLYSSAMFAGTSTCSPLPSPSPLQTRSSSSS